MLVYSSVRHLSNRIFFTACSLVVARVYKRRYAKRKLAKRAMIKLRPRMVSSTCDEKRPYRPNDYFDSPWFKLISNPATSDPSTVQGKTFRKRFRVPFFLFLELLVMARRLGFKNVPINCAGCKGLPLELQVLGVLRVLGRGTCFDGIEELTGGSSEAHRNFFHKFIKLFSKAYFNEYVYLPRNQDELERWTMDYNRMGLPGVLGSTDCVHVKWERCPAALANNCTGKEGYPTLAWQCSVNHKMRFISTSKVFYGASNDKTICKYDDFTRALRSKTMFGDTKFTLRTRTGEEITETGLYLICDGGFCKWRCLMTGYKFYSSIEEARFSAQMESTRKDVERAFGILKGRFRCLKLPILLQTKVAVDYMFTTCIILHNMILTADGRDKLWEMDVDWAGDDGHHDEEDWSASSRRILHHRAMRKLLDYSSVGIRFVRTPDISEDDDENEFYSLRRKLVDNYYYLSEYEPHKIEWLN